MIPDFAARLDEYARVLVQFGVNLQPGQPLLVSDPYDQQGVARSAEVIVEAVRRHAAAFGSEVEVYWSDPAAVRSAAESVGPAGFAHLVRAHVRRLERHAATGGAFLFLTGSQPRLLQGLSPARLAVLEAAKWRILGPLVQRLIRGETQWCLAPAPSPTWAALTFDDLPSESRLAALWYAVFAATRVEGDGLALERWRAHHGRLAAHANRLNQRRPRGVRYVGPGTDLEVILAPQHHWCTAGFTSRAGVSFVANLPTEEVFTAPARGSVNGTLRASRPVAHAGALLEGVELEFRRGRVVASHATRGAELLAELLATDDGSSRLGEVALLGGDLGDPAPAWPGARSVYYHILLDENAANHVALGESYPACHRGWFKHTVNRSAIHLDLPLAAQVTLV